MVDVDDAVGESASTKPGAEHAHVACEHHEIDVTRRAARASVPRRASRWLLAVNGNVMERQAKSLRPLPASPDDWRSRREFPPPAHRAASAIAAPAPRDRGRETSTAMRSRSRGEAQLPIHVRNVRSTSCGERPAQAPGGGKFDLRRLKLDAHEEACCRWRSDECWSSSVMLASLLRRGSRSTAATMPGRSAQVMTRCSESA